MRKKKIGKNLGTPGKQTKRNETQHNEEMIAKMHGAQYSKLWHTFRAQAVKNLRMNGHGPAPLGPPAHMYLVILNTAAAATATAASAAKDNAT